jgi:hypothetical protein
MATLGNFALKVISGHCPEPCRDVPLDLSHTTTYIDGHASHRVASAGESHVPARQSSG